MPGAHRSAPPHRSWRAQSPPGQSAAASKHVGRLLLSLLLLAGCGGLVWLLVALFLGPGVHFACLPVVDYDVGAVEPVAFCREDADRWRQWKTPALARPPVLLDDLQFSGSIGTLTTRLAAGPRDAQMLYVIAQGISDGGEACLLLSDYLRGDSTRRSDSGRYKLGDLLRQVDRCPARLKLLILDVDHLAADPRSAMAVNEFPRLLEEELRRVDRPGDPPDLFANLWVLSANGVLETSHASSSSRASAFGHFMAEGLQGAADLDGSGWVDLDELTEFVRTRVALWVRQETAGQETQTPCLLRGRLGRVDPPAGIALLKVSDTDRSATLGTAGLVQPADAAKGKPPKGNPPADPPPKKDSPQTAPPETLLLQKLLAEAWALRDRVEVRRPPDGWSPVDYAPHLWREYQALLLGYEWRSRAGAAFDAKALADDLQTKVLPLGDMSEGKPAPPEVARWSVLDRLFAARREFLEAGVDTRFQGPPEQVRAVRDMIRLKNDLVFRAPYYAAWHARVWPTSSRPHRLYRPILDLLGALATFADELDGLEAACLSGESPAAVQQRLDDLALRARRLEELRSSVEGNGLQKDAADLADAAEKEPQKKGLATPIDALLSVPLLPAELHTRLLAARTKLDQPLRVPAEELPPAPAAASPAKWQWDRLRDQFELEARLVRLADPQAAVTLPGEVSNPDDPQAQGQLWPQCGQLGSQLGDFYQGLPEAIEKDLGGADPASQRAAGRLLGLVDARDAGRVDPKVVAAAVRPLRLPIAQSAPPPAETPAAPTESPPAPDVIHLLAHRLGAATATVDATLDEQGKIELGAFPNRVTAYRFELVNSSGRKRKLHVKVFDATGPAANAAASPVATADLELPEAATPVAIAFPAAPTPEAAGDAKSPGKAETSSKTESPGEPAAKPPGDRPGIAIGGQLALVVTDAEQPERKWTKLLDLRPLEPSRMLDPTVGYDARRGRITVDLKAHRGDFFPKLSADESVKIVWETAGELPPGSEMDTTGQLATASDSALLYAQVDPRPDKVVEVRLSVDGYPRAFVYRVRCDRDRQAVPPETDLRRVTIVEPVPNQAYRIPLQKPLAVRFQVDAPADAFVTPGDVVEVGIDRDRDREFSRDEKPLRFASDRQIAMLLRPVGPDGTVSVAATASDFAVDLDPGGLDNVEVDVMARLSLASGVAARASVRVLLDGAPPEVTVAQLDRTAAKGSELKIVARVVDRLSGVKTVTAGLMRDNDGKLEAVDQPAALLPSGQEGIWRASLPTEKVEPGPYVVLLRAVDQVGCVKETSEPITILPPQAASSPAATTSTITGRVLLNNGKPLARINVTLEGTGRQEVTDDDGRFTFREVPPGQYTLHAQGVAIGKELQNSQKLTLPAASEPAVVEIVLTW